MGEEEATAAVMQPPLHIYSTHGIGTSMLENWCGTALG